MAFTITCDWTPNIRDRRDALTPPSHTIRYSIASNLASVCFEIFNVRIPYYHMHDIRVYDLTSQSVFLFS